MNTKDIRWKQRFSNFKKALELLELAMKIPNPDIIQKAGLVQFFEISFELSWNVMKDYLEDQGLLSLRFPRDIIKKAFEVEIIADGDIWLDALKNRNLTTHTYEEEMAEKILLLIIHDYYPLLKHLYNRLSSEI